MPSTHTKLLVHAIFSTKNRESLILGSVAIADVCLPGVKLAEPAEPATVATKDMPSLRD